MHLPPFPAFRDGPQGSGPRSGLRLLEIALAAASLCLLAWHTYLIPKAYTDSWAPMAVALQVLKQPGTDGLYEAVFFSMGIKFQYPPSALLYLDVLKLAGLTTSLALNALNWLLLILNAGLVGIVGVRLFSAPQFNPYRRLISLLAFTCALAYGPIAVGFNVGQIQIFLNLLFTLTCLALISRHTAVAGALMGAATAIKPQFGILLLQAALRRHWKFVLGFCLCACALGLLSIGFYGWSNHIEYFKVLRYLSERGETYAWNNSVNGILNRLLENGSSTGLAVSHGITQSVLPPYHPVVYWTTLATTGLLILLPLVLAGVLPREPAGGARGLLLFAVGAVCSVIASPIAWIHHYGILLPIYLISLAALLELPHSAKRRLLLGLLVVSFGMTAARYPFFASLRGLLTLVHAPTFFGACLLLGILLIQLLERAATKQPAGAAPAALPSLSAPPLKVM